MVEFSFPLSVKYLFGLLVFTICSQTACDKYPIHGESADSCEDFYKFFKDVWLVNEETLLYNFKGDPNYWFNEDYFKPDCFIGLSGKKAMKILGRPTKMHIFKDFEFWIYCLNEKCTKKLKQSDREIRLVVKENRVTMAYTNPLQVIVPPEQSH